jgi:hypothetical protein
MRGARAFGTGLAASAGAIFVFSLQAIPCIGP